MQERQKKIQEQDPRRPARKSTPTHSESDTFHDGRHVLDDVLSWHSMLRSALRSIDSVTGPVLDLVDGRMLLPDPGERITAKKLCHELKEILKQAEETHRVPKPSDNILQVLLEVDEEAHARSTESDSQETIRSRTASQVVATERQARKSKRLDVPVMKTTHRSEYLRSALNILQNAEPLPPEVRYDGAPKGKGLSIEASNSENPGDASPGTAPMSTTHRPCKNGHQHNLSGSSTQGGRPPIRPKPRTSKTDTYQNVFQARQEIAEREKGNYFKQTRKDTLLTSHFGKDKRDIVSMRRESKMTQLLIDQRYSW
jgi:hypothetical protein